MKKNREKILRATLPVQVKLGLLTFPDNASEKEKHMAAVRLAYALCGAEAALREADRLAESGDWLLCLRHILAPVLQEYIPEKAITAFLLSMLPVYMEQHPESEQRFSRRLEEGGLL